MNLLWTETGKHGLYSKLLKPRSGRREITEERISKSFKHPQASFRYRNVINRMIGWLSSWENFIIMKYYIIVTSYRRVC